jgi:hypothetical protein
MTRVRLALACGGVGIAVTPACQYTPNGQAAILASCAEMLSTLST